jgi:hypothetical protein
MPGGSRPARIAGAELSEDLALQRLLPAADKVERHQHSALASLALMPRDCKEHAKPHAIDCHAEGTLVGEMS